ncbi:UDP-N-acetylmuramate dehydrogenase [Ancylomarina longa]|uniref:UDP-N-acetylenolpyruvoylglucosamine reductase n=1 Tax=Ancylomarina longa TaxID=2487017 RepID=A0A434AUT2_9BACT|nr:UDP-N-acetylmuramate dehydrogenase [Ancylomarina longa]RUT78221.1 UDP-N-acetylmuramate dehydrogenase [Ancylomarina longa]
MAVLHENYSLKKYNTFGIEAKANYFFEFESQLELIHFLKNNSLINSSYLILGGGSNLLFTDDFNGLVLHPNIRGIEIQEDGEESILVKVGANENWDEFVAWSVKNNYSGIENLSLIPGAVGATPVQNIGAYGVEVQEVIERVDAISIETNNLVSFSNTQCEFDYRNSVFKKEYKNLFVITHVYFRLSKTSKFKIHYGAIEEKLKSYSEINLRNIREVIIKIRKSKLPDPEKIGNAGSFFKNPIIPKEEADILKQKYQKLPIYPMNENESKVAAGWLIDQCGWKGKQIGNAGVHKDQALVLVNLGNASGSEILNLANEIRKSVIYRFGIKLEMEVNAI